ncbi:MAG: hypothetical protein ACTHMV_19815 [Chitinophagaceae bacterium]
MKPFLLLALFIATLYTSSCAQKKSGTDIKVGDRCEDCEAIYESPVPFEQLPNMVWLSDWGQKGRKLAVNGTVFRPGGSRAANVVIYIYHTDSTGVYPTKGDEKGIAKKHGYLRGWMKTNELGEYKFFTLRPGSYPEGHNPAHIHAIIKEPGKSEYWIDDYLFDDDPLLGEKERKKLQNRGGNGILTFKGAGNIVKAERNIYLGKNIPNYSN